MDTFARTEALLGKSAMEKLSSARVAVFGIGGVGSYAVEALARSGIGALDLIDADTVSVTNINRQLIALHSTVGMYKTAVAEKRIADINPDCVVKRWDVMFLPETAQLFDFSAYDYVIDAIDTVQGKIRLVQCAKEADVPIICAMGAGNKLDATAFRVADIAKTSVCPLAKVMRRELKKIGIDGVKVVYSEETPLTANTDEKKGTCGRNAPGSIAFVPSVMGLILAGEVIKDIAERGNV